MARPTLLAYIHHRWDSGDSRTRTVFTRLAASRRVLLIEEPVGGAASDSWEKVEKGRNLTVWRPHLTGSVTGFDPPHHARLARLLDTLVALEGVGRHTAWLSTPLAYPPAHSLAPEVILYDCDEDGADLPDAPAEWPGLEARLLRSADVVFASRPGLYRARKGRHPNVHFVPGGVDVPFFRRGRTGQPIASDYADDASPRLGFLGTIDEHVDLELLDALALSHPKWNVYLVGPLEGIDASDLPRLPNLHFLGARPVSEIPRHLAAWDVCLLPYVLSERSGSFRPTQALELMAAEHPIVSTSLADIAVPYEDIMYLGDGPRGFLEACERALATDDRERARRATRMREVLADSTWDRTLARIEDEMRLVEENSEHYGRTLELSLAGLLRTREA